MAMVSWLCQLVPLRDLAGVCGVGGRLRAPLRAAKLAGIQGRSCPKRRLSGHRPDGASSVHGRPWFAKLSILDGSKVKIAPVHPDFDCSLYAAVPDGFCWLAPNCDHALKVLRT